MTIRCAAAARVVRGLIPHAERWRGRGERLWPIARHLVKLVEAVPGARRWRQELTKAAGVREAGPEVLELAARLLEQGPASQPSAPA
jgi:tRNA-dihydrouridine synthase A